MENNYMILPNTMETHGEPLVNTELKVLEQVENQLDCVQPLYKDIASMLAPGFKEQVSMRFPNVYQVSLKPYKKCTLQYTCNDLEKAYEFLYKEIIRIELYLKMKKVEGVELLFPTLTSIVNNMHNELKTENRPYYGERAFRRSTLLTTIAAAEKVLRNGIRTYDELLPFICPTVSVKCITVENKWYFTCVRFNGNSFTAIADDHNIGKEFAIKQCLKYTISLYIHYIRLPLGYFSVLEKFVNCHILGESSVNDLHDIAEVSNAADYVQLHFSVITAPGNSAERQYTVTTKLIGDEKYLITTESNNNIGKENSVTMTSAQASKCGPILTELSDNIRKRKFNSDDVKSSNKLARVDDRRQLINSEERNLIETESTNTTTVDADNLVTEKLPDLEEQNAVKTKLICNGIQNLPIPELLVENSVPNILLALVLKKYSEVQSNLRDRFGCENVLASIIMARDENYEGGTVVSLCSGNKSISGNYITNLGDAIIDSHAEVLARRGLIHYLYSQLNLSQDPAMENASIFKVSESEPRFILKNGVSFYLYVSSAPCGDSRIFVRNTSASECKKLSCSALGKLRLKLETGCGAIPASNYNPQQSFSNIKEGADILTMCCSDKILKTNLLGIQGSLLTHFIDPIYYKEIIVGDYFSSLHCTRAFYGRIENPFVIQEPYFLNKPPVSHTTETIIRSQTKSKFCFNWVLDDGNVEEINSKTGKKPNGAPSRLCKMNFFKKFVKLLNGNESASSLLPQELNYLHFKQEAKVYNEIKSRMFESLDAANLGRWVIKPTEVDDFVYCDN